LQLPNTNNLFQQIEISPSMFTNLVTLCFQTLLHLLWKYLFLCVEVKLRFKCGSDKLSRARWRRADAPSWILAFTHPYWHSQNRLISKKRPEYKRILNWLDLGQEPADPLVLLARTEGIRETDSLTVFEEARCQAFVLTCCWFFPSHKKAGRLLGPEF